MTDVFWLPLPTLRVNSPQSAGGGDHGCGFDAVDHGDLRLSGPVADGTAVPQSTRPGADHRPAYDALDAELWLWGNLKSESKFSAEYLATIQAGGGQVDFAAASDGVRELAFQLSALLPDTKIIIVGAARGGESVDRFLKDDPAQDYYQDLVAIIDAVTAENPGAPVYYT